MEILIENKKIKDYKRENPHLIILIMRVSIQRPLFHPWKIFTCVTIFYPSYGFLSLFDHPDHIPLP